ncbi:MAG: InlB B-repeat-containing protein, partial [Clostridia bacterium]|nr:InlB B-repeat-containing protein [Clostridia bacterium]
MDSQKVKSKSLSIAILIIVFTLILGAVILNRPATFSLPADSNDGSIMQSTMYDISYDNADSLGKLQNNATYMFTDKNLIDGYRAGTEAQDTTIIRINALANHGSQSNPYVIADKSDWRKFLIMIENDSSRGAGKYFLLVNSIDFAGEIFYPLRYFNGTFYGLGNSLKNVTISDWDYLDGAGDSAPIQRNTLYGYGLICRASGATVTDFIVENFNYAGPEEGNDAYVARNLFMGGIIGYSVGANTILNCHTVGIMDSSNVTYTVNSYKPRGGIVGSHYASGNTNPLIIYRCSSQYESVARYTVARNSMSGGIIGECYASYLYIYDCVAKLKDTDICTLNTNITCGGIMALAEASKKIVIENTISVADKNFTQAGSSGALCGFNSSVDSVKLTNCFADGAVGLDGSAKKSEHTVSGNVTLTNSNCKAKNIHKVKSSADYAVSTSFNGDRLTALNIAGLPEVDGSLSDMIADAVDNINSTDADSMSARIWNLEKTSNLAAYLDRDYNGSESIIDYNPVRNYLEATVTFKNLTGGGSSEEELGLDTEKYSKGTALPAPQGSYVKQNHTFKGWTMDKTGASEPFKDTLPNGIYGEVTFYAVWGLPDDFVASQINTSLSADKTLIEYDGEESITLTGKVEYTPLGVDDMTNPYVTYYWKKDGDDKENNETGELIVKTVNDSGKYSYNYRIVDSNEPLWYYDGCSSDSASGNDVTVTVEKGKVESFSIELLIDSDTAAYFGRELSEINFTAKVKNKAGKDIELLSCGWDSMYATVDTKPTATKAVNFEPKDKDNYQSSYTIDAVFDVAILTINFKLIGVGQEVLEVEAKYGNNYTSNRIIYMFEQAYLEASSGGNPLYNDVADRAPYLDGKPIVANAEDNDIYNGSFLNIRQSQMIEVTFKKVPYEVTFDPDNGDNATTKNCYYGQYIGEDIQEPTKGEQLFLGWYFDTVDEDGNAIRRAWRFVPEGNLDADRVTKSVTLKAEWLTANELLDIQITINPQKVFRAMDSISENDLTVVATYYGKSDDGKEVTKDVTLAWSKYSQNIKYVGTVDNRLHVSDGGAEIEISYQFGANKITKSVLLDVQPIDIDTSGFDFGQKGDEIVFEADGTPKNLPELDENEYINLNIDSVEYEYYKGNVKIQPEDVVRAGEYTVRVVFTTSSPDYKAETLVFRLILGTFTEVRIEWDYDEANPYMYNGKVQAPTAKVYRSNGSEITNIKIEYEGDVDKIARGEYRIRAVLEGTYRIIEGESCDFKIVEAKLELPIFRGGVEYDGKVKNLADYLDGYDADIIEIIGEGASATAVGTYRVTLKLKDTANCKWSDGSTTNKQLEWSIDKATLIPNWDKWEFVYDGESGFAPKITGIADGLAEGDSVGEGDIIYTIYDEEGNEIDASEVSELGSYKIVARLNDTLSGNYKLDEVSKEWAFVVTDRTGKTVLIIEWGETKFL